MAKSKTAGASASEGRYSRVITYLANETPKINELSASLVKFNNALLTFSQKVASELQSISRASQLAGMKLGQYQTLLYATKQVGGSITGTLQAFSALGQFLKNSNNRSVLRQQGIATKDASGKARDTYAIFSDLSKRIAELPDAQARALAQKIGIGDDARISMQRGLADNQTQYQQLTAQTHFDPGLAEKQSQPFFTAFNKLNELGSILGSKYGARLGNALSGPLEKFINLILTNMPEIDAAMDSFINKIGYLANFAVDKLPGLINQIIAVKDLMGGWNSVFNSILIFIAGKWLLGILGAFARLGVSGKKTLGFLADMAGGGSKKSGTKNRTVRSGHKPSAKNKRKAGKANTPSAKPVPKSKPISVKKPPVALPASAVKTGWRQKLGGAFKNISSLAMKGFTRAAPVVAQAWKVAKPALRIGSALLGGPVGIAVNAISLGYDIWSKSKSGNASPDLSAAYLEACNRLSEVLSKFTETCIAIMRPMSAKLTGEFNPALIGMNRTGINNSMFMMPTPAPVTNNIQQTNQFYINGGFVE